MTLKGGEVFIVNLTGAQYGHYKPILPLKAYLESGAEKTLKGRPFGFQRSRMVKACEVDPTGRVVIRKSGEQVYKCFNAAVMKWQDQEMLLPAMLRLKEEPYLASSERLTTFVHDLVTTWKKRTEEGGKRTTVRLQEDDPMRVYEQMKIDEQQEEDRKGWKDQKQAAAKKQEEGKGYSEAKKKKLDEKEVDEKKLDEKKLDDALANARFMKTSGFDLMEPARLKGYQALGLCGTLEDILSGSSL